MLQAATPEPEAAGVYTGPYVTGEEYQQLLDVEAQMNKAWSTAQEGYED